MIRRKPASSRSRQPDSLADTSAPLPLIRVPLALARPFIQICTAARADILAAEGLESRAFSLLAPLGRALGSTQNTLAARMGVDRARVSQLADELEAMGFIDRRVNGADRRARVLRLTPRGEQMRARLQPGVRAAQMRVIAPLSPDDRERLLDLLARVVQANRALARPGPSENQAPPTIKASRHVPTKMERRR